MARRLLALSLAALVTLATTGNASAAVCDPDDREEPIDSCASPQNADSWRVSQPVAKLVYNHPDGSLWSASGFLVGSRYLLTNQHVITGYTECNSMQAFFNHELDENGLPRTDTMESCLKIICQDETLDYTLLTISGTPQHPYGSMELANSYGLGIDYVLPQHPLGGYKRIHRNCTAQNTSFGRAQHDCDTNHGSSGSPLVDPGVQLVYALHLGGIANGTPDGICPNQATVTPAIIEHLFTQCNFSDFGPTESLPPCPTSGSTTATTTCNSGSRIGYEATAVRFSGRSARSSGTPLAVIVANEDIRDLQPHSAVLQSSSVSRSGQVTDGNGVHTYSFPPTLPVAGTATMRIMLPGDLDQGLTLPEDELVYRIVDAEASVGSFEVPPWVNWATRPMGTPSTGENHVQLDPRQLSTITLHGTSGTVSMTGDIRVFIRNDLFPNNTLKVTALFTGTYDFDTNTATIESLSYGGSATLTVPTLSSIGLATLVASLLLWVGLVWRRKLLPR